MRPQRSMPTSRRFPLVEFLIGATILGMVASAVVPQFTDATVCSAPPTLQSQLQTIRSQIELYNVQNPGKAFDDATLVVGFWDPLLQGNYLQSAPINPLQNSTTVGSDPGAGVGWVWRRLDPADSWTLNLYIVDETGNLYDGDNDGLPD